MTSPSALHVASRWIQAAQLDALKPNDRLTVYHGTRLAEIFDLINGFDANKVHYRHYGGPRHAGLFVSPSEDLAERFSDRGEVILEIQTLAKNLHGTDFSGNIGREQHLNEKTQTWLREEYPDSFRPYLSMTMLQSSEPQALLRGLVSPHQIKRVRYKEPGGSPKWYSRKEFLDLGLEMIPARDQPYGRKRKIRDLKYDLSYPGYSVDEFFSAAAGVAEESKERVIRTFKMLWEADQERGDDTMGEFLEQLGFEPTAVKAYRKKLGDYWSRQRVASRWSQNQVADAGLASITEYGVRFQTGVSVTFPYMRNTEGAPKLPRHIQPEYGQDIEPAGRYMLHAHPSFEPFATWEGGEVTFHNPLVLEYHSTSSAPEGWKRRLSIAFGGKKKRALSTAIRQAGFDGIVTVDGNYTSEIVEL